MNKTALGLGIVAAVVGVYALWPESEASAAELPVPDTLDDQQAAAAGPTSQQLLNTWKSRVNAAISACAAATDLAIARDEAQDAFDISYQSGSFADNDRLAEALRQATVAYQRQQAICDGAQGASMAAMRNYEASL